MMSTDAEETVIRALAVVAMACYCVQPTNSIAAENVRFLAAETRLLCKGTITISSANGIRSLDKQEVVAHIGDGKISFSGNPYLFGNDIRICTPSDDRPYFDDQNCGDNAKRNESRHYGTYNKINGAIDLTKETPPPNGLRIEGSFKCDRTDILFPQRKPPAPSVAFLLGICCARAAAGGR